MTLDELREKVKNCKNCPLCDTRINAVFGSGNEHAEIMFVGEAPGRNEDETGEPFVGAAGRMLNDFSLQAFDIKDADRGPIGWSMGDKKEMAYTEENAKFFYNLLIAICKINEQVKNFVNEPELLQEIIHKQVKLLN